MIDLVASGFFSAGDPGLFAPLVDELLCRDAYKVLADYQSYVDAQDMAGSTFADRSRWSAMSILNVARIGRFSSDRSIMEYCRKVWGIRPVRLGGPQRGG